MVLRPKTGGIPETMGVGRILTFMWSFGLQRCRAWILGLPRSSPLDPKVGPRSGLARKYACIYIYVYTHTLYIHIYMYIHIHIHIHIHIYIYTYTYTYIHIHIHIHVHVHIHVHICIYTLVNTYIHALNDATPRLYPLKNVFANPRARL